MGWVVQSDVVLRSCDAVLDIIVTASRVICDASSASEEKFLSNVGVVIDTLITNKPTTDWVHCPLVFVNRILGKSLDEGLVPLMFEKDVVNLLNYVPRYRELKIYIENGVSSIESHVTERLSQGKGMVIEEILEENVVETIVGKEEGKLLLVDKCIQAKYMQDGIQNATVSDSVQVVKYTFIELNQDLFQQDNVVDAEDYTYMLDKLQQGNEDVVFGNIDQENKDVVFGNKDQDVDEE
ncbi:hypothetical protein Tco_1183469 [Tanacetum coccineum]